MSTFRTLSHVDVSPGTTGSWQTVNLSSYLTSGATGCALHFVNSGATDRECGWRKTGSSDDEQRSLRSTTQFQAFCGVDGSRQVDIYIGHADAVVYLVGEFLDDCVFFTTAISVRSGSSSGFTDIDISSHTGSDTAIAAIWQHVNGTNQSTGVRKNGSTDNRTQNSELTGGITAVDGSQIFECNSSGATTLYLLGYIKDTATDVTLSTNATDRSLGSTGSYGDLTALPSGATAGLYEVINGSGGNLWSLREKGASEDYYKNANLRHNWHVVKCDGSQLVEGKIASTSADFFQLGYFSYSPDATVSVTSTNATATGQVGDETVTTDWVEPVTGVSATGSVGDETVVTATHHTESVTGVSATGSVGDETVSTGWTEPVTGLSATGSVGDETVTIHADVAVTGLAATGTVGDETVIVDNNHTEIVTGVSATGSVGDETVTTDWVEPVTGVSATGSVGDETVSLSFTVEATGIDATGYVGDETVSTGWTEVVTGESATGAVGTVDVALGITVTFSGLEATGSVGDETVSLSFTVEATGLSATGSVGDETVSTGWTEVVTGESATGAVGTVDVALGITVTFSGLEATGATGVVSIALSEVVGATGVYATGYAGRAYVWSIISDPSTAWSGVSTASAVFSEVSEPTTTWSIIEP